MKLWKFYRANKENNWISSYPAMNVHSCNECTFVNSMSHSTFMQRVPSTLWTSALTSAFFVFCSGGTHVGQKSAGHGFWADPGLQGAANPRHPGTCGGSAGHGRWPVWAVPAWFRSYSVLAIYRRFFNV